jgi:hypothetical protein
MSTSDANIASAVTQGRGREALPEIEFRKMRALESIAATLIQIAEAHEATAQAPAPARAVTVKEKP